MSTHTMLPKLLTLKNRHEEIERQLATPEIIQNMNLYREYSQEYAELEPVVKLIRRFELVLRDIEENEAIIQSNEPELKELAAEELIALKEEQEKIENEIKQYLVPKDPNDKRNVFLEIRAAAGGDESAIFAGDLLGMYLRFAENQKFKTEIISESAGEHGGFKEVVARIEGIGAYGLLKFESGAHRVQRVPDTETQGRIHTSTCTVAIMPEADEIAAIEINPSDLRIDTFRASGAGGQHVNKTESAIRITHIPSGIVVECQDERSQHKNRARAMSLLAAKLLSNEQEKQTRERTTLRRNLVGTGDRSERIRTYNYPQGRVTDHRINLTLYKLPQIISGAALQEVIDALRHEHQLDLLAASASADELSH